LFIQKNVKINRKLYFFKQIARRPSMSVHVPQEIVNKSGGDNRDYLHFEPNFTAIWREDEHLLTFGRNLFSK